MRKEFLEAGRIVGTHGIKGELRLEPWCDSAAFLTGIRTLYWDKDGRQPVGVLHSRPHKSFLLLTLEGVSSATEGDTLRGRVLYFKKADISLPDGRVFVQDLLQCTVKNAVTGQVYGKVTDVFSTGANDVYEITGENGRKALFPAVPSMIDEIDVENGVMTVRPIGGIFDDED